MRWLQMQGDADRRILAQLWGLAPEADCDVLAAALLESGRVEAQWQRLHDDERAALTRVLQDEAVPVAIVERMWGAVREPARFANPRAYLQALDAPTTTTERLYMMGLLVRGQDERGPVYRVLHDFVERLPTPAPRDRALRVAPVAPPSVVQTGPLAEVERTILALLTLAYDGALQTLEDGALNAASLRKVAVKLTPGNDGRGMRREADWPWLAFVRAVAVEAGLVRRGGDGRLQVQAEAMQWLSRPQASRVESLLDAYTRSPLNELELWGDLVWRSPPLSLRLPQSRRAIVDLLCSLPDDRWFGIDDVIAAVQDTEPDFLRRDGRYDTWLVYDEHDRLVAGGQHWWRVEGCFAQIMVVQMLHWLGLTDLGDDDPCAFRWTPLAAHLLHDAPAPPERAPEPLVVQATFEIIVPPGASLLARFQVARIAELVDDATAAIYRLTRRSVLRAVERGIGPDGILRFLQQHGRGDVPQAVASYIREWGGQVGQVRLEEAALLRADDPVRLVELRRARELPPIEELTPLAWKVAPGDVAPLLDLLDRAGFSVQRDALDGHADGSPFGERDLRALVTAAHVYAEVCAAYDLPSEVSAAMLARLRKLVPSRHVAAAQQAARQAVLHLKQAGERRMSDQAHAEGDVHA